MRPSQANKAVGEPRVESSCMSKHKSILLSMTLAVFNKVHNAEEFSVRGSPPNMAGIIIIIHGGYYYYYYPLSTVERSLRS